MIRRGSTKKTYSKAEPQRIITMPESYYHSLTTSKLHLSLCRFTQDGYQCTTKTGAKKMRHHLFPFRQQHYVYQIWRGKNELYRAQKPFCHGPVEKGTISSHYLTIFTLHKATTHFKLRYPRALLWSHHLIFAEFTGHTTLERRYVLETNTAPWQIQTFDKHYWAQNCSLSSCHFLTVPSNSGNEERTSSSRSSNANCFKQTGDCMGKKQI